VADPVRHDFFAVVGTLFILAIQGDDEAAKRNARWVALWTTIVTFAVSLILIWRFDAASPEFSSGKTPWLGGAINYHMGVDGISLPFVILTTAADAACASSRAGSRSSRASRNTWSRFWCWRR